MNTDSRNRRDRAGLTPALVLGLVVSLVAALPAAALAQDATEGPAAVAQASDFPFPSTLARQPLEVETFSGPEWVAKFAGGEAGDTTFVEGTQALVDGVGKTLEDLSVKSALYEPSPGNHAVVAAFRIAGTEARDFVVDAVQLLLGDLVAPRLVLRPMAGKWVLRVVDATMPGVYPRTVYLKGDTAWVIEGDEPYVFDALDQLPDAPPVAALAEKPVITQLPLELLGRRRTGLWETTEPLFLPTLSERAGPELEQWLLDLYLGAGISPAQMVGVVSWWGIESNEDSVQIEGYQVADAAPGLVEQLRSKVILGGDAELPEGVTRSVEEIGGHEVTTLDFGTSRQHVFATGDTVWIVTDNVGEAEMAAEAIAALP